MSLYGMRSRKDAALNKNRLLAARPDRGDGELGPGQFRNGFEVGTSFAREVLPFARVVSGRTPAGKLSVDGFATAEHFSIVRDKIVTLGVAAVANADFDSLDRIEPVDVGNGEFVDTVDHGGMARGDGIEPAAPARPSGG